MPGAAATYVLTPVPAPRMVHSDRYNPRLCVRRYFAFRDAVRSLGIDFQSGWHVTFVLPMPQSWTAKKRAAMDGQAHTQTPDLDNLFKGLTDAIYYQRGGDAAIAAASMAKIWGRKGKIIIQCCGGGDGRK